ncbi:hypothetical protein WJX72_002504 [[Myrmecia] bisecta]|uniref:Beta-lactamase-related domain-containing protein n=1 Tax=[Myrmecia] bisecta TaxID=41462 RepID=A0AAW1R530_9CHLO
MIDHKAQSVKAAAGGVTVDTIAVPNPAPAPFPCLLTTSAQVGEVIMPVFADNGTPLRQFDWPEAFVGSPAASPDVDYAQLAAAIAPFFDGSELANATGTRAVLAVRKGQIVAERYAAGLFNSTPLLGWSMGKTLTAALTAIRVADGAMQLTDLVNPPSWSPAEVEARNITVEDLLQQLSGIQWAEVYLPSTDATEITSGPALNNTEAFAAAHPQAFPADRHPFATKAPLMCSYCMGNIQLLLACHVTLYPVMFAGTQSDYSTANVQLLEGRIRRSFKGNDTAYWSYPYNRLFKRLGAPSFAMSTDGVGTFAASSSVYATVRDWARLGQLYLQDGVWNGTRILPEGWVKYTRTSNLPAAQYKCSTIAQSLGDCGPYSALWWPAPFDSVSSDAYAAEGFEGQFVAVLPSQDLVVVFLAWAADDSADDHFGGLLVHGISQAVKS